MIDTRASVRRAAPPSIWAVTLSRRWRSRAVPNQVIYAQTQRLTGARICRNEYFIRAHIYTPPSIFTHGSLDLIREPPRSLFHRSGRKSDRVIHG
jgi:hypothetical protein